MAEELIDIYDETERLLTPETKTAAHKYKLWHRTYHCWIVVAVNNEPHVLVQRRSAGKTQFPNLLTISAGGHVHAGETVDGLVREIAEEIGLTIPLQTLLFLDKGKETADKEFVYVYACLYGGAVSDCVLQPEEVSALYYARVEDMIKLFNGQMGHIELYDYKTNCVETAKLNDFVHFSSMNQADHMKRIKDVYYDRFHN